MSDDKSSRIEKIDQQIAQLKARRQKYLAQAREKERRLDTRRKIILGGAVLALMREGDEAAIRIFNRAKGRASDRDRPILQEWNWRE